MRVSTARYRLSQQQNLDHNSSTSTATPQPQPRLVNQYEINIRCWYKVHVAQPVFRMFRTVFSANNPNREARHRRSPRRCGRDDVIESMFYIALTVCSPSHAKPQLAEHHRTTHRQQLKPRLQYLQRQRVTSLRQDLRNQSECPLVSDTNTITLTSKTTLRDEPLDGRPRSFGRTHVPLSLNVSFHLLHGYPVLPRYVLHSCANNSPSNPVAYCLHEHMCSISVKLRTYRFSVDVEELALGVADLLSQHILVFDGHLAKACKIT